MAATFTITRQVPVTDTVPGGTFVRSTEITFTTVPSGIVGKVRVPDADYTVEHVAEVVGARAALLEAAQAL